MRWNLGVYDCQSGNTSTEYSIFALRLPDPICGVSTFPRCPPTMKKLKSVRCSRPTPPWMSAPYSHGFELETSAIGESVWIVPEGFCAINALLAAIDIIATIPHSIRIRVISIVLTIESRHRVAAFASLGSLLFLGLGR